MKFIDFIADIFSFLRLKKKIIFCHRFAQILRIIMLLIKYNNPIDVSYITFTSASI